MTYVYTGPHPLATIGIAMLGGVAVVLCQELLNWWEARRDEGPGPVDAPVDGVPIEPRDDPPFPDGWHATVADGYCADGNCSHAEPGWTPSPDDVELGRQLTRERFGKGK
jgi:hypothetical protein